MPADRSRAEFHVQWELPRHDLPKQQVISFAPNVTPGTFECPPLVEAPLESSLFPSEPVTPLPPITARRSTHGKKRPIDHIPRPPNAFILFRTSFIKNQHVPGNIEGNHSTLSKIIGLCWQNLPYEERQVWQAKAKLALDEHKRKYPEYSFKPAAKDGGGTGGGPAPPPKRKVRESERADQQRCEKIADLLVKGKKGADLHQAVEEFDRVRVAPSIQPRFEAPMTACHYRRSSSAPAPDSPEAGRPIKKEKKDKERPLKRSRAASSRPSPARDNDASSSCFSPYECDTPIDSMFTFPLKSETVFEFAPFTFDNDSSESVAIPELQHSQQSQLYPLSRSSSYESLPPLTPSNSFESLPSPQSTLSASICSPNSWNEMYGSAPVSPLSYGSPSPTDYISPPSDYEFSMQSMSPPPPPTSVPIIIDNRRPSVVLAEQIEQWTREHPDASLMDLIETPTTRHTHEYVNLDHLELFAHGLSSFDPFTFPIEAMTQTHPAQAPVIGC